MESYCRWHKPIHLYAKNNLKENWSMSMEEVSNNNESQEAGL